jgi:cytochrome c-type biogenesis protein CcmE
MPESSQNNKLLDAGIHQHDENYMPPEVADALEKAGTDVQYGQYKQKP